MAGNDITQLAVQGTVSGQNHVHTLHFRHLGLADTEQELINAWQAGCRTQYRALFVEQDSPVQLLTARQVCGSVPLRAPAQEVEVAGSILGTRTQSSDPMPAFCAGLASIRTASAGKSYRGRSYIGGLAEGDQNTGILSSAMQTLLNTYFASLLSVFGPSGTSTEFRWFVFSPTLAGVGGVQCQNAGADVTTYIIRHEMATMRSRKIGHGT